VPFCDIRPEVGASASIVFSYFMELEVPIRPDLAATLLFAIETDLAGAAGTPGELDNIALSSLTLLADPRKLYQMRYVDLPQSYFRAYAEAIMNAVFQDGVLMTHLKTVDSLEKPAVMGDFLLRFDKVGWALVTAEYDGKLVLSLRTQHRNLSAADAMRKIVQPVGQGGGHKTKAGGFVDISKKSPAEVEELRQTLWRRYLKAVGVKSGGKPQKLVP
jgi:nanoRNase/pAp phosphatase (c-di-AMP/oligoRNAs hydrolase)